LINECKEKLIQSVQEHYKIVANEKLITPIAYRPFDKKYVYYDTKLVERSRKEVMQHFIKGNNLGLQPALYNSAKAANSQNIFIRYILLLTHSGLSLGHLRTSCKKNELSQI
jgi:hypothetical protein